MDLEENIRIAAKEVWLELTSYTAFIRGAMSPEAKAYWYNEFKAEQVPIIQDEYSSFNKELVDQVLKVFGKRPYYPYGTVQSDPLYGATQKNLEDAKPKYVWPEPVIMKGFEEYKKYMRDCPDPSFTFEDWKNMMTKYNQVTRKIVDEISQSVLGVSGHPIDIVLSEKWYQPNVFDNTDICDNQEKPKEINWVISPNYLLEYKKAFDKYNDKVVIIGVPSMLNIGKGLIMDPITFKEMSIGITEQIKDVKPFVMHNIHIDDIVPPIDSYEKPWDTKKQKRNNYKKKRRK